MVIFLTKDTYVSCRIPDVNLCFFFISTRISLKCFLKMKLSIRRLFENILSVCVCVSRKTMLNGKKSAVIPNNMGFAKNTFFFHYGKVISAFTPVTLLIKLTSVFLRQKCEGFLFITHIKPRRHQSIMFVLFAKETYRIS